MSSAHLSLRTLNVFFKVLAPIEIVSSQLLRSSGNPHTGFVGRMRNTFFPGGLARGWKSYPKLLGKSQFTPNFGVLKRIKCSGIVSFVKKKRTTIFLMLNCASVLSFSADHPFIQAIQSRADDSSHRSEWDGNCLCQQTGIIQTNSRFNYQSADVKQLTQGLHGSRE